MHPWYLGTIVNCGRCDGDIVVKLKNKNKKTAFWSNRVEFVLKISKSTNTFILCIVLYPTFFFYNVAKWNKMWQNITRKIP